MPNTFTNAIFNGTALKRIVVTVAVLALTLTTVTISSLALFTDSETVPNNAFSAGTLDLTASPATAALSMPAMNPGDQITGVITVGNAGSIALRYAMPSTTTEDTFAGALVMTVKSGVATCDDANFAVSGTVLYSGPLGTNAPPTAVFGSNAQGVQGGERSLTPGSTEDLCVNVTLPLTATNASQGLTTSASFTFDGEQIANNP
ncbi:MAG: hypothetical protein HKN26_13240 [Acidimicrobiales bacterium]|nr:hypothetical protein [Acidimicrobiales bacterium]